MMRKGPVLSDPSVLQVGRNLHIAVETRGIPGKLISSSPNVPQRYLDIS
jgi:hypothetical protein